MRYLDFIERSTNYDAFAERFRLGYTPGVMIHNNYAEDDRGTWWLGSSTTPTHHSGTASAINITPMMHESPICRCGMIAVNIGCIFGG